MKNKAFTLIELLVVVLIIGILAAVALPGYQRAVHKSRMTEVAVRLKAMTQAVDTYVLENGFSACGPDSTITDLFDVYPDIVGGLTKSKDSCGERGTTCYGSKYVWYNADCFCSGCEIYAYYSKSGNPKQTNYPEADITILKREFSATSGWETGTCTYAGIDPGGNIANKDGAAICSVVAGYTPIADDF